MEILKTIVTIYGGQLIGMIMAIVMAALGLIVKRVCEKLIDTPVKEAVAADAVKFVEQVWKTLHGPEKLQKALETAALLLKKKGIKFDAEEMKILIEAAVGEFNDAFMKPLYMEDTAAAVRRAEQEADADDQGEL